MSPTITRALRTLRQQPCSSGTMWAGRQGGPWSPAHRNINLLRLSEWARGWAFGGS